MKKEAAALPSTYLRDPNIKLSTGRKIAYATGELGYSAMFNMWITAFLAIYCTDTLGIPAATLSILLLVVRIFDAFNDPFLGSLADKTKPGRILGRYGRWVFWGAIAMGVFTVLLYSINPEASLTTKTTLFCILYVIVTVCSTCLMMPYGALLPVQTSNSAERSGLISWRIGFASSATQGWLVLGPILLVLFSAANGAYTSTGFIWTVLVFCAAGIPMMFIPAFKCKEVMGPPPQAEKIPFKKRWQTVTKNRYMIIALIANFVFGLLVYARSATYAYYFTYVAGDAAGLSFFSMLAIAPTLGGCLIAGKFMNKIGNRGRATFFALIFVAACYLIMGFFRVQDAPIPFYIIHVISCIAAGMVSTTIYALAPDAIDYAEHKTGIRADGFLIALTSFMLKAGNAIGTSVMILILGILGYVANAQQTPMVLDYINGLLTWIPGILSIVAALPFITWKLSTKQHAKMMEEVAERKASKFDNSVTTVPE